MRESFVFCGEARGGVLYWGLIFGRGGGLGMFLLFPLISDQVVALRNRGIGGIGFFLMKLRGGWVHGVVFIGSVVRLYLVLIDRGEE